MYKSQIIRGFSPPHYACISSPRRYTQTSGEGNWSFHTEDPHNLKHENLYPLETYTL